MLWLRSTLTVFLLTSSATDGDWPQWLGPNRDAISNEVVAPWKDAPKVVWRFPAGEGNGSPSVANGKVFFHAKIKDKDEEEVIALDTETGKEIWRTKYPRVAFKSLYGNGPRATPAIDGNRVYTFGITGLLTCFDTADGKQIWQVDTLKEFGAPNPFFGMACSPLVEGKNVLVNVGGKGASIVAFDKESGKVSWQVRDDRASYSSPIVFGEGEERQVVFLTGQGLVSLNPADGKTFWNFPLVDLLLESSTTPVRSGNMLMASSITYGSVGLNLGSKDGKPSGSLAWKNDQLTCYFATPVPVGDQLFVVTGTKPPALTSKADLHCLDFKTGKELWVKQKVGKYHATLLRTGDSKLLLLEEAGNLVLLEPSPTEYRELARSKVCGETWVHPALANGRLYVRDGKEVICLSLKE